MIYTKMTNKALCIAYEAHKDQVDKAGIPYIFHPIHLAEQMKDEISVCVALLHDVVEDTPVTIEELEKEFPKEVVEAVRILSREEGTDYFEYIRKVAQHPVARKVKMADLEHNSDETRMAGYENQSGVREQILKRREKYEKARRILEASQKNEDYSTDKDEILRKMERK